MWVSFTEQNKRAQFQGTPSVLIIYWLSEKCPPCNPLSIILIYLTSLGNGYFGANSVSWPLGIIYRYMNYCQVQPYFGMANSVELIRLVKNLLVYISYAVHNNHFWFSMFWYFIHNLRKCTVNIFLWLGQWWLFRCYLSGFIRFNDFLPNAYARTACEEAMWNMCIKYFSGFCQKWGILKLMPNTFLLLKNENYRKGYVDPYIFTI